MTVNEVLALFLLLFYIFFFQFILLFFFFFFFYIPCVACQCSNLHSPRGKRRRRKKKKNLPCGKGYNCEIMWALILDSSNNYYFHLANANGHTTLRTPLLVRSAKLSNVGSGQYLDGWPPGNTRCCWHFFTFLLSGFLLYIHFFFFFCLALSLCICMYICLYSVRWVVVCILAVFMLHNHVLVLQPVYM